ncbi:ComF family protein [Kangiella sp.]|uniref:ComF family protein n=1 Tax=Kangiella sp. TaxID=1920245 RepID=UPI003A8D8A5D
MVYNLFSIVRESTQQFTGNCSLCGLNAEHLGFCEPCLSAVQRQGQYCQQCGNSLGKQPFGATCGQCLRKPPRYQKLVAATHYEFPVSHAISEMKFEKQLHHIRSFSNLLIEEINNHYQNKELPEAIVPIPLHSNRLRERGFNQSQLIAKHLTRKLQVPLLDHALLRVKDTPHQIGLKAIERRKNLKRAFEIKQTMPKHIALVDDVVTTGSTIQEASKQCLKHGVERIDVWCLAKT